MTALAADRETKRQEGEIIAHPVAASTTIYLGSMVCLNASKYAVAGANTAGYQFIGIADEKADNSSGSAADISVRCYKKGVFDLVSAGLTLANVGSKCYLSDDQTVTLTPTNVYVGILDHFSSATVAPVRIDDAVDGGLDIGQANIFTVCAHWSGTVGASSVVAVDGFEFDRPFTVLRAFADAQTAPGGAYVCTVSCFGEDITITGSATHGEDKAINAAKLANTDYDIALIDDNASAATSDVSVIIVCAYN